MRLRSVLSVALIAALGLSLTGCAQIMKAITPAPKINHVTIAAKVAAPGAPTTPKLVSVPSNLPVWPDSSVVKGRVNKNAKVIKGANGTSWSVSLATHDSYQDVVNGTAKGFLDAKWQVMQQDVSSAETSVTVLTVSSQTCQGVVTVSAEPDKTTQIGYVITTPAK
ncbi:MAG TPA: hypothetical protein VIL41_03250 [Coriobacteriia bacterium]